jgi:hypothetical protein
LAESGKVIEPSITKAQYKVLSSRQIQSVETGEIISFAGAGTLSGIARHFYGNAKLSTVRAISFHSGRGTPKNIKYNDRRLLLQRGEVVVITTPLVLVQTSVGANPTRIPLKEAVRKALSVAKREAERAGIPQAKEMPSDPKEQRKLADKVTDAVQGSLTKRNLQGHVALAATFDKRVQGLTLVNTDVSGPSADVRISRKTAVRVTMGENCRNAYPELTGKKRLLLPLPKKLPEPPARPVRIFVTHLEAKSGLEAEVITEYRYDTPWVGNGSGSGTTTTASIYSNNRGYWWFGPAGMFERYWGNVEAVEFRGGGIFPGVALKYEEPLWNIKAHVFVGDLDETVEDNTVGFKSKRTFHDVFTGDISFSSKQVVQILPFLEEVNLAIFGRLDPGHVDSKATIHGKKVAEEFTGKNFAGIRGDLLFQSVDVGKNGFTLTFGTGYEFDSNEFDSGNGPFVTLSLGQRQVNRYDGSYLYKVAPRRYAVLYFGTDVKRGSYRYKATVFWAEAYYAHQDAKLAKLIRELRKNQKPGKGEKKEKEQMAETPKAPTPVSPPPVADSATPACEDGQCQLKTRAQQAALAELGQGGGISPINPEGVDSMNYPIGDK